MFAPFLANDNEEEEEALLFYGDDMRAQFSLARAKAKMFKISNSLFSERWIFNEDLSLFFLSADRGMCIQDSLWNDEREEKKKQGGL